MFASDLIVLAAGALYLDIHQVMYTLIAVFIGGRLIDLVESGAYHAKAILVMSEANDRIANAVMADLERGVTILKSVGAYTRREREALYIVCSHGETVRIKSIIRDADPAAFLTVSDVEEVRGEGFAQHS